METKMKAENRKILMLGNSSLVIFGFRGELIECLIQEGYEVVVSFPNGPFGAGEQISKDYGCEFIEIPITRHGKNPFQEIQLMRNYTKSLREIKPDIVLAYTVKCDIYGGIACKYLKIPFIPNITGLGKGLTEGRLLRLITTFLYKRVIKNAACVFFQNQKDKQFFIDNKISFKHCRLLPGSGVNLDKFKPLPYPETDTVIFTFISRIMKAKGIDEFLEAASVIREQRTDVEFHVCGYCEENYHQKIAEKEQAGTIVYHGMVSNILNYEKASHCVVLPSFHPEGVSNVLLEAAACARPIITTDRTGCKEVVDDGVTGYLIKEQNSEDLIEKMYQFLQLNYEQRKNMGEAGRKKVEDIFDRRIIINEYMDEINSVLSMRA